MHRDVPISILDRHHVSFANYSLHARFQSAEENNAVSFDADRLKHLFRHLHLHHDQHMKIQRFSQREYQIDVVQRGKSQHYSCGLVLGDI